MLDFLVIFRFKLRSTKFSFDLQTLKKISQPQKNFDANNERNDIFDLNKVYIYRFITQHNFKIINPFNLNSNHSGSV